MNGRAHIIDIDRLVLNGVDTRHPERLHGLIEAEVSRVLGRVEWPAQAGIRDTGTRVAGEVAGGVVQALRGGTDHA